MTQLPACGVCGGAARPPFRVPPAEMAPDLDGRPGEPTRSTLPQWIATCRRCGTSAPDLSRLPGGAGDAVRSAPYQALRGSGPALPALRWACICESLGRHAEAAEATLQAAWALDDAAEATTAPARGNRPSQARPGGGGTVQGRPGATAEDSSGAGQASASQASASQGTAIQGVPPQDAVVQARAGSAAAALGRASQAAPTGDIGPLDAAALRLRAVALWGPPQGTEDALRQLDLLRRAGSLDAALARADALDAASGHGSAPDENTAAILAFQRGRIAAGDTGRHMISSALRPPARRPHVTHGAAAPAPGGFWRRLFRG